MIGPSGSRRSPKRRSGLRDGRSRWTVWTSSWTIRSSAPVGVVADRRVGAGRARPQHHARRVEQRQRHAVGLRHRVLDDNVDHPGRCVPDLGGDPLADRLHARHGPECPRLGRRRVVDPEVGGRDGPPVRIRPLGTTHGSHTEEHHAAHCPPAHAANLAR